MEEIIAAAMIVAVVVFMSVLLGYATYIVLNAVTPYELAMTWTDILIVGAAEFLVLVNLRGDGK